MTFIEFIKTYQHPSKDIIFSVQHFIDQNISKKLTFDSTLIYFAFNAEY